MKSNHLRFEGRNVFIIGGSAGIGKGLALEFAKQGANVVIAARNKKALETTVTELRTIGFKNAIFDFVVADVSNVLQIQKVAKKVLKILRGLDLLICNSGYAKVGKVEDLSESDFRTLMEVNFF
ncbi:SDR family NAD(P)-dependent oxidoreductase, partial [Leptospira interrogans]